MGVCCSAENEKGNLDMAGLKKKRTTYAPGSVEDNDSIYREEVNQVWKDYDTGASGKLERKEAFKFLQACMKEVTGQEPTQDEIEKNFEVMDLDGSGDIDKEEAFKFLKGYKIGHQLKVLMGIDD